MRRRSVKLCALGVVAVATIGACKAVEELQDHLSGVQFEMRTLKLDVAKGTFVTRTPPPTKRQPQVIVHGGAIYALGGIDGSLRPQAAVEKYDPATDTWTTLAPWPSPRVTDEFFELGGQLCTLGGLLSSNGNVLTCYDPAKNTWADRAAMPDSAGKGAFRAVVAGGALYAFAQAGQTQTGDAGAFDATTYDEAGTDAGPTPGDLAPTDFYTYDPAKDAWTQKASAPFDCSSARSSVGPGLDAMVAIGAKIYVIGCQEKLASTTAVTVSDLVYDTAADSWSEIPPSPVGARGAFVISGKIVAVSDAAPFVSTFDPAGGHWSVTKAAPPPFLAAGGLGLLPDATGVFYFDMSDIVGKQQVYNGEVWRYDVTADTWTKVATLTRDLDPSYFPGFVPVLLGTDPYLVGGWESAVLTIH